MYSPAYELVDRMQGMFVGRRPPTLGAPREPEDHHNIHHHQPQQQQLYANETIISASSSFSYQQTDLGCTETLMVPPGMLRLNKRHPHPRQQSGMLFNRLPDGIVLRIFSYLETTDLMMASQTCKRFETLCWNSPECWRVLHLKGDLLRGDKLLKTIFKRLLGQMIEPSLPFIERIYVSNGCRLTDKSLGVISRRCPELTHLQLQCCNEIYDTGITEILHKCTNLQHLDLTGCLQVANLCAGNEIMQRQFPLQYLDLTDCISINDCSLQNIVRHCPALVYLYLRRCVQITDAGLKCIASYCASSLRELSISDCTKISDFGLYELAGKVSSLRYLSVAKCIHVTDDGLKMIARRCYKLRYLNTRGCEAVSDESIMCLARCCPRLRAIDIGSCEVSDTGLKVLAESCPNLKKLSLKNCDMISDNGLNYVSYYCRGLQHLNIQDCPISIEGYRSVKMYCKRCVIEHTNPGFG